MNGKSVLERRKQIEEAELALTCFNAKRALSVAPKALTVTQLGDSLLLMDANSPQSIYYNRVKGFGGADLDRLDAILAHYEAAGLSPCFDLTPDQLSEPVAAALNQKGYFPAEQLAFLDLDLHLTESQRPIERECHQAGKSSLRVERITEEGAEAYVRLIMASNGGMELPEAVIHEKKAYFCRPDFINYTVYCDGEPAALGSLFVRGKSGYIANDYTFQAFRGRGCQRALLACRIAEARALGLEWLCTDVVFGTVSHDNMLKAGFETAFLNTFFLRG